MFTKKRAISTLFGVTILLLTACGGRANENDSTSGITGTGSSDTAPTVTALSPTNNATGVYTDQALKATFSTTVDTATVTLSSNTDCTGSFLVATTSDFNNGDCIAMQQSVSQSGTEITVRPAALLSASTPYYVRITSAVKSTGAVAMLTVYNAQFTTGTGFSPLSGEFGTDCSAGADTLAAVRAAIPDPEATIGPYVVKQLTVTAVDKDGYFYVQAGTTGPAVLVRDGAHKASGLGLQVGDEICLGIDKGYKYNELQRVTQITAIKKTDARKSYAAQTISAAVNNDDYEAELVKIGGTLSTKSTTLSGGGYNHIITYGAETIMLREIGDSGKMTNFAQGQAIEVTTVMSQYSTTYQLYLDSAVGSVAEDTAGTFNVTGGEATSATQIKLTFGNTPDAAAATFTNYTANNGLTISAVSVSGITVTLTTSSQTVGQSYTVTVANVKRNADSAALTTNTAAVTGFVPPASFTTGQVVINEVHAAPSAASKEFVELYNTTASPISLSGATIWYKAAGNTPNQSVTLTGTIPANGYYTVLDEATTCSGTTQVGFGSIGGLENTAGAVVLTVDGTKPTTTSDSNIRDVAQWGTNSENWGEGGTTGPAPSGNKSLSRSPNGSDTNNNGNDFLLSAAADGTCGAVNWAPDVTAPTVASATPANTATGVSLNPSVSVTFDEAMDVATVNAAFTIKETNCSGTVKSSGTPTASNGNKTFAYSLASLSVTTVYATCVTTGAKDVALNALASPYSITWTTGSGGGALWESFENWTVGMPDNWMCAGTSANPPIANCPRSGLTGASFIQDTTSPKDGANAVKISVALTANDNMLSWSGAALTIGSCTRVAVWFRGTTTSKAISLQTSTGTNKYCNIGAAALANSIAAATPVASSGSANYGSAMTTSNSGVDWQVAVCQLDTANFNTLRFRGGTGSTYNMSFDAIEFLDDSNNHCDP